MAVVKFRYWVGLRDVNMFMQNKALMCVLEVLINNQYVSNMHVNKHR